MRLIIFIRNSKHRAVPFNYQPLLTGVIHKWIGSENEEHGRQSLFSFSFLQRVEASGGGLILRQDSHFFFSSYDTSLCKRVLSGIQQDPNMFFDINVSEVQLVETPEFSDEERFLTASPILLKSKEGDHQWCDP